MSTATMKKFSPSVLQRLSTEDLSRAKAAIAARGAFHGGEPAHFAKFSIDTDDLKALWALGRIKFIAYEPVESERAGTIFVHFFQDHGNPSQGSHETCDKCGMIWWKGKQSLKKLPWLAVAGDDKTMLIVGAKGVTVGDRGIKG